MCGIAGVYLRDPSLSINMDAVLDTLLEEIEHRGRHATGYVALTDDGVGEWQKAACGATAFCRHRRSVPEHTRVMLAHTRWATQGLAAFMENNHPIRRGPFFIIHNGHVRNDSELFVKSERKRFGQVDSEAIAAKLSHFGDLSMLRDVMAEVEGSAAVAAVDERDCSRLSLARGDHSPLWVYNGTRVVIFGSTEDAVVKAHSKHVGAISTNRLTQMKEGDAWEWRDGHFTSGTFEIKRTKYVYTPAHKNHWDWSDMPSGYSWENDEKDEKDDKQLTVVGSGYHPSNRYPVVKAKDVKGPKRPNEIEDVVNCDNCNTRMYWDEINYRVFKEEQVSFHFCDDCVDLWDEEEDEGASFLGLLEELEEELDEDLISDDYEKVNSSIVNSIISGLRGKKGR